MTMANTRITPFTGASLSGSTCPHGISLDVMIQPHEDLAAERRSRGPHLALARKACTVSVLLLLHRHSRLH